MMFEIEDLNFSRYSDAQIEAARPEVARLAGIMRQNLRLMDTILGVRPHRSDLETEHDRISGELHAANSLADALQNDLDAANSRIAELEVRLAESAGDEHDAVYYSVGLVAHAHKVVVDAARRALLQHHHPDRCPPDRKAAATANFQVASAAFDKIAELRGC